MIRMGTRWTFRLAALVAVLALALGAAACGSDDDGGDKGSATAADKQGGDGQAGDGAPEEGIQATGEKGEAQAAYAAFVDSLYKRDGEAVCGAMTDRLQREIARGQACTSGIKPVLAVDFSKTRPYVVEVEKKGKELVVWAKTPNSETYPIPFLKVGGEWKVNGGIGADAQPAATRGEGKIEKPQDLEAPSK